MADFNQSTLGSQNPFANQDTLDTLRSQNSLGSQDPLAGQKAALADPAFSTNTTPNAPFDTAAPSSTSGVSGKSFDSGLGSTSSSYGLGNTSSNIGLGNTSSSTGTTSSTSNSANAHANTAAEKAQATLINAKDTIVSGTQSAIDTIQAHPTYQQLSTGPMAQNIKNEANLTSSEFQNLADSRKPGAPTATGQPLTHYHSLFYTLLSWENPRATAIVFASSVAFIFTTRYLNLLHYVFKFSYIVLGVTAALEIAGKLLFDDGLASKMRPRKYWTISKDSLSASLDDVEQLLNFFVIEAQRILYAENIYATIAVFLAALISFGLIKIVPVWGLALMADVVVFIAPLIYVKNREVIDSQVQHATEVVNQQTHQIRDLAVHHANQATEQVKTYAHVYSEKAQEFVNQRRGSTNTTTGSTTTTGTGLNSGSTTTGSSLNSGSATTGLTGSSATKTAGSNVGPYSTGSQGTYSTGVSGSDFPSAPSRDPLAPRTTIATDSSIPQTQPMI